MASILYKMDTFLALDDDTDTESSNTVHEELQEFLSRRERALTRNTFTQRLECDPQPTPYDHPTYVMAADYFQSFGMWTGAGIENWLQGPAVAVKRISRGS
jgi:hypothetical protein